MRERLIGPLEKPWLAKAGASGLTKEQALARGICIVCKGSKYWYSEAGRREYMIHAICENCLDEYLPPR